ncbi:MAG: leucyl/phenylalanyl-tRNA--protein transferase [Planktomarina sp.]
MTPDIMLQAYAMGIFPMAEHADDHDLFWLDPERRGIIPLNQFHISRSLAKRLRREPLRAVLNRDFEASLIACADRDETWINPTLHDLYMQLHTIGAAHAIEVWDDDTCLGGAFGLSIRGAFFGESMYSASKDGSKLALAFLVAHLVNCGFKLLDTQFVTDHLLTMGAAEISRDVYHAKLNAALQTDADIQRHDMPSRQDVLQRRTQIS